MKLLLLLALLASPKAADCPPGARLEKGKCVPVPDARCAEGLHFEEGKGCVDAKGRPPKKATTGGLSDRVVGTCNGAKVEVQAAAGLLGGKVSLLIDGKVADSVGVLAGRETILSGTIRGQEAELRVEQRPMRARYTLTVGGKECPLRDP